mgnify:CR=1 FL=1
MRHVGNIASLGSVCKSWREALQFGDDETWKTLFFWKMFFQEPPKNATQEEAQGTWRAQYFRCFVDEFDYNALLRQAMDRRSEPGHVFTQGHVTSFLQRLCDYAERAAVGAIEFNQHSQEKIHVPTIEQKSMAHQIFNTLPLLKLRPGQATPSASEFLSDDFTVVRSILGIWARAATATVDRIVERIKTFSEEHQRGACIMFDTFMQSASRWLAHYIDKFYARICVEKPNPTGAQICEQQEWRLRESLLPEGAPDVKTV